MLSCELSKLRPSQSRVLDMALKRRAWHLECIDVVASSSSPMSSMGSHLKEACAMCRSPSTPGAWT